MYVCTLQLTIISSVQSRQTSKHVLGLIPESMNSYLPTLTIFFPLHLDLAATYHETSIYIAAMASGGENLIGGKTTLRFDLYRGEVVIFLFAAAADAAGT